MAASFALFGTALIDIMSANAEVAAIARDYLPLRGIGAAAGGVFAFLLDGVYIGATWARDMRNLMVLSLLIFLAAWVRCCSLFGNTGCGARCWCSTPPAAVCRRCAIRRC